MSEPIGVPPETRGPTGGMTPYITIKGHKTVEALEFYQQAFGAEEVYRNLVDDGRVMHCHLRVNGSSLMLSDDYPDWRGDVEAPDPGSFTLHIQVDDADRWFDRAVEAGCTVAMPLDNQFWGDRS